MSDIYSENSQSQQQIYEEMERLRSAINKISRIANEMSDIRDRAAQKKYDRVTCTGQHYNKYINCTYDLADEYEEYILALYSILNRLKSEYNQL